MSEAAAVLLALLAVAGIVSIRRPEIVLGAVLGLPLFFKWEDGSLDYAVSVFLQPGGTTLPLATFAVPVFLPLLWRGVRSVRSTPPRRNPIDLLVAAFATWALLAFAVGLATGNDPSAAILIQTISPVFFYVVGRGLPGEAFERAAGWFVAAATASALFLLGAHALAYEDPLIEKPGVQLSDELPGPFALYQAWDYVPALFTIAALVAAGLALRAGRGVLRPLGAFAILSATVALLNSRGILLMLSAGVIVLAALALRTQPWRRITAAVALFGVIFFASAALGAAAPNRVLAGLPGDPVLDRSAAGEPVAPPAAPAEQASPPAAPRRRPPARRTPSEPVSPTVPSDTSDAERSERARQAADRVEANPIFGDRMAPARDATSGHRRSVLAHNQYLDYAVRGGLPLALLFAVIGALALAAGARRTAGAVPAALAAAVGASLLVANFTQVNFVQPLTAYPLWLGIGALWQPWGRRRE